MQLTYINDLNNSTNQLRIVLCRLLEKPNVLKCITHTTFTFHNFTQLELKLRGERANYILSYECGKNSHHTQVLRTLRSPPFQIRTLKFDVSVQTHPAGGADDLRLSIQNFKFQEKVGLKKGKNINMHVCLFSMFLFSTKYFRFNLLLSIFRLILQDNLNNLKQFPYLCKF